MAPVAMSKAGMTGTSQDSNGAECSTLRATAPPEDHMPGPGSHPLCKQMDDGNDEINDTRQAFRLLEWRDLPAWRQEGSTYIQTGYRPSAHSILECCKSWGYLHNETVNIYSHIIGAVVFAVLPIYIFLAEIPPRYKVATSADLAVCIIYFVGVTICFIFSVTFHTIMSHSSRVFHVGIQLDFEGIILLMWGASVPMIYYGFYCDQQLQKVYWGLLSGLAVACSVFTFQPRFRDPHLRPLRAATFGSYGLSFFIPVFHALARYGWAAQSKRMGLVWVLVTLAFNTLGATAYAVKFPEKWFRRTFDIFGASHQILHVAVIAAGLAFTCGILEAFDYLHDGGGNCSAT